jgi:hypothetical protein
MQPWSRRLTALPIALVMTLGVSAGAFAQDDDVAPAPASIGADIPLTYFGPPPSSVQKELVGPLQLLNSGTLDQEAGTIELPLYRGELSDGRNVWYILTDTTDETNGTALGLNVSGKLAYSDTGNAVREATLRSDGILVFEAGAVDFSPERVVVPGEAPAYFPPIEAEPGSVGDEDYSPLVKVVNAGGHIYNAPVVAFDVSADELQMAAGEVDHAVVHDKVVAIAAEEYGGTVTIALTAGFSFAKPVLYISTDANVPLAAAMEGATYAPALSDIRVGGDDGAWSAVERIFAVANGPTGGENPQRQGFDSALSDGRTPLNVLGGIPTVATDYSPLWDLNLGAWTPEAVEAGYRARVIEEFQILGLVEQGWLTGPDGGAFGSTGIIVNCPIVFRFL